jgi:hypothetical protein
MSSRAGLPSASTRNLRRASKQRVDLVGDVTDRDSPSPRIPTPDVDEQVRQEGPTSTANDPGRPVLGQNTRALPELASQEESNTTVGGDAPRQDELERELEELRRWRQREENLRELTKLRELKRKVQQGDLSAFDEVSLPAPSPRRVESVTDLGAPRPKDPETFANRDRQQYNCWARDCEAIFRGSPSRFATDTQRVDFGIRFLDETVRSTWDTYREDHLREDPFWEPTWAQLKAVMLDCLGPLEMRRLQAHNDLKRLRQRHDQDPNVLLARLNTLWSEMEHVSEEQRRMDFMGALLSEIQKELMGRDPEDINTVSKVNTAARFIWNKTKRTAPTAEHPTAKREGHARTTHEDRAGPPKTRKKAKKAFAGNFKKKQRKSDPSGPKDPNMTCWGCNEPGHFQKDCPKPKEAHKESANPKSGKGSGQRS